MNQDTWKQRAEFLFQLLDDIDTLDDVCKDDYQSFRDRTRQLQQRRHVVGASFDGHTITWGNPPMDPRNRVGEVAGGPSTLRDSIRHAINCHSAENGADCPDFILAEFLVGCLAAFDKATNDRDRWHGFRQSEPVPENEPQCRPESS